MSGNKVKLIKETRPCGECLNFIPKNKFSICSKKLMVVSKDLHVSYMSNKETCFEVTK